MSSNAAPTLATASERPVASARRTMSAAALRSRAGAPRSTTARVSASRTAVAVSSSPCASCRRAQAYASHSAPRARRAGIARQRSSQSSAWGSWPRAQQTSAPMANGQRTPRPRSFSSAESRPASASASASSQSPRRYRTTAAPNCNNGGSQRGTPSRVRPCRNTARAPSPSPSASSASARATLGDPAVAPKVPKLRCWATASSADRACRAAVSNAPLVAASQARAVATETSRNGDSGVGEASTQSMSCWASASRPLVTRSRASSATASTTSRSAACRSWVRPAASRSSYWAAASPRRPVRLKATPSRRRSSSGRGSAPARLPWRSSRRAPTSRPRPAARRAQPTSAVIAVDAGSSTAMPSRARRRSAAAATGCESRSARPLPRRRSTSAGWPGSQPASRHVATRPGSARRSVRTAAARRFRVRRIDGEVDPSTAWRRRSWRNVRFDVVSTRMPPATPARAMSSTSASGRSSSAASSSTVDPPGTTAAARSVTSPSGTARNTRRASRWTRSPGSAPGCETSTSPSSTTSRCSAARLARSSTARNGLPAASASQAASFGPGGAPIRASTSAATASGDSGRRSMRRPAAAVVSSIRRSRWGGGVGSRGRDEKDAERPGSTGDRPQQVEAGVVGPVGVVGHQRDRVDRRRPFEDVEGGADRIGTGVGERHLGEQPSRHRPGPMAAGLVGRRGPDRDTVVLEPVRRRGHEAGLPRARLADEVDEPAGAVDQRPRRLGQDRQLLRPLDQARCPHFPEGSEATSDWIA